jgi:hypothetical protein
MKKLTYLLLLSTLVSCKSSFPALDEFPDMAFTQTGGGYGIDTYYVSVNSQSTKSYLKIWGDRKNLDKPQKEKVYDLSSTSSDSLRVFIRQNAIANASTSTQQGIPYKEWIAIAGKARITVIEGVKPYKDFKLSITLENVVFQSPEGAKITLTTYFLKELSVSYYIPV